MLSKLLYDMDLVYFLVISSSQQCSLQTMDDLVKLTLCCLAQLAHNHHPCNPCRSKVLHRSLFCGLGLLA